MGARQNYPRYAARVFCMPVVYMSGRLSVRMVMCEACNKLQDQGHKPQQPKPVLPASRAHHTHPHRML